MAVSSPSSQTAWLHLLLFLLHSPHLLCPPDQVLRRRSIALPFCFLSCCLALELFQHLTLAVCQRGEDSEPAFASPEALQVERDLCRRRRIAWHSFLNDASDATFPCPQSGQPLRDQGDHPPQEVASALAQGLWPAGFGGEGMHVSNVLTCTCLDSLHGHVAQE